MDTSLEITTEITANVVRNRTIETLEESKGNFALEHWRNGTLLGIYEFSNGATNEGKQYMLAAAFNGMTPITAWHLGLIDGGGGTPVLANADTMASHAGWNEFVLFDEAIRQVWAKTINTLVNQAVSSAAAQFTISTGVSGTGYVAGAFLCGNNVKGGTTGTLWATGLFASTVPVQVGDVFKLNYTTGL